MIEVGLTFMSAEILVAAMPPTGGDIIALIRADTDI